MNFPIILGSYEEPSGDMNWPPSDAINLTHFLGFWMNRLVAMNTRQAT